MVHIIWMKNMSYIKWFTESQTAWFLKEQNKPINLYEWQGQIQWRHWQSIIISVRSVTFYGQGCFHSQCVFKYRAWNLIIINSPAAKSEPKYLFILYLTKHRISIILYKFLIRSVSNWSKDSSKLKFRMISSDDMDSNDLWAQRNDSTSSLFWKSDYKTTAKKVIRHFFCLLIESSGPSIWKHWVSKFQSGRSGS